MKWTVLALAIGSPDRFGLLDAEGETVATGPCAKALAVEAFRLGAEEVDHRYDLATDDCESHALKRVGR